MKRNRSHEEELSKTKRLGQSYSSPRYHYEYELSEDNNSIVDPPERTALNLVSVVRINFRVNYKLRLLGGDVDETLDSIQRCFDMSLYLITGFDNYWNRVKRIEYRQLREDMEHDVHNPETFLRRFLTCHRVEVDVIKKLICDIKDFVNRKRAHDSLNRVIAIAISIQVYTLQQEGETIDAATQMAITTNLFQVEDSDEMIKLLHRPPPYKFMIEFDNTMREDCCICLSELSVGEEVLFLSCSHAYHYDCLIRWLENGKQCPVCRSPMNLEVFINAIYLRVDNLIHWKRLMDGIPLVRGMG